MNNFVQIALDVEDVKWAIDTAMSSIEKWSQRDGYYNNRLASHLTGKLGELAMERYLLENRLKLDSHFRFSERENLCDLVVKIKNYSQVRRLEVKTWSAAYWADLGRCIAVAQYPILKKKADLIIWCVVEPVDLDALLKNPIGVTVSLAGWSTVGEIRSAPIKRTGAGDMRKVENYQLEEGDLRPMQGCVEDMLASRSASM